MLNFRLLFMKRLFVAIVFLTLGIIFSGASFASYGSEACQPIYGGGQTCVTTAKFILDKKVLHPKETKGNAQVYVDNLSINDPKFVAVQRVKFQLVVTNTGNETISELTLTDILPDFVDFVSGPGTYDSKTRTMTLSIPNLNPDESRKYTIETKVRANETLPQGQGVVCVVNQASLMSGSDESRDNSQFCIQKTTTKGGLPVLPAPGLKQTPATGPEMLGLIGLIPAGLAGLLLRRKASK